MKIYTQEINDGITALHNRIVAECSVISFEPFVGDVTEINKTVARYLPSNPNQIDLHYLNCVLASVGWNKNDDVFDKEEFLKAKSTPADKPFNFMHDEDDIIGHITDAIVVTHDGKTIDFNTEIVDDNLDIVVSAVIYKCWSDIEQSTRIKQIIDEIVAGEWCVSMECLFRSFDYDLVDDLGNHQVIARNQDSAFLTKHLKCYGGTGVYDKYKIGRLLRNITFSGIGIVKRPANNRSIILNNENSLGEIVMADLAKTAAELKVDELEIKVQTLETTVAETKTNYEKDLNTAKATIEDKDKEIANLNKTLEASKAETMNITEQLKAMENKLRCMERRSVLASLNLDEESILELIEDFKDKDDSAFAVAVKMTKKMKPSHAAESVVPDESTSEVEVEVETEEVVADDSTIVVEDSNTDKVQSTIASWFEKTVLNTTKNLK